MTAPRRKKSEWAQGKADERMRESIALESQSSGGNTRAAAQKFAAIRRLRDESMRFSGIAQALRRKGQ